VAEPVELTPGMPPSSRAEALAYFKARSVLELGLDGPVLGADTVVAVAGEVLGKPSDEADARRMLETLSGTRHKVITGLAVLWRGGRRRIASEMTYVTMRDMMPEEIDAYIAGGEWVGKAGAYAIQETADRFVQRVEGSFSNVVGLPVELVRRLLAPPGAMEVEGNDR
jgi:septum formation protein